MTELKYIAVGLMAIGMLGAALGVSNVFSSLLNGISRNPETSDKLQRNALIGAALVEAMGLLSFVIAILALFSSY